MDNVTFIIKTYERPYCIKRLVRSIYKRYPNAKIIIADDSKVSCKSYFKKKYPEKDIRVFELENDCGLSAGRNYLVDRVETEYFVLLDDDMVFDNKTNIPRAVELIREKDVDILGGYFRNYTIVKNAKTGIKYLIQRIIRFEKPLNYIGEINYDEKSRVLNVDYIRHQFPEYTETDIVHNIFIAKTDSVRDRNRWNEELKVQEHTAFFLNAKKNGLKTGFTNELSAQHRPTRFKKYGTYRTRDYTKRFMENNNIDRIIASYDDGTVTVTDYADL